MQKPPAERDAIALEAAFAVFDASLEWLRRNFLAAVTVVYLPSPAATYRHAEPSVDVYTRWPLNEVRAMPAAEIYGASQQACEAIRALTIDWQLDLRMRLQIPVAQHRARREEGLEDRRAVAQTLRLAPRGQ